MCKLIDSETYGVGCECLCFVSGDGGNDVSMIQAANVGLGIVGKVSSSEEGIASLYNQLPLTSTPSLNPLFPYLVSLLYHSRKVNRHLWRQISPSLNSNTSVDFLSGMDETGTTCNTDAQWIPPHMQYNSVS